jgi:hypothetical protein
LIRENKQNLAITVKSRIQNSAARLFSIYFVLDSAGGQCVFETLQREFPFLEKMASNDYTDEEFPSITFSYFKLFFV